jgi:hypothetical protein
LSQLVVLPARTAAVVVAVAAVQEASVAAGEPLVVSAIAVVAFVTAARAASPLHAPASPLPPTVTKENGCQKLSGNCTPLSTRGTMRSCK